MYSSLPNQKRSKTLLPSVLEEYQRNRRNDDEDEDDQAREKLLVLDDDDSKLSRRDALMKDDDADDDKGGEEKEEEYDDDDIDDFRAPPGLSHARPRRGLLRDDVNDDSDDDSYETDEEGEEEENLDRFFSRLYYEHFLGKGFLGQVSSRVANALILLFTIWMSGFLLLSVDWQCLRTTCAENAERCDIMRDCVVMRHPLRGSKRFVKDSIVCSYLALATAYLCWNVARLVHDLPELREMREFSKKKLALSDRDFWTVTWVEIVERLVHVQETGALTFRRKRGAVLDERDIVARIMRKENYLIGMVNRDVVNTRLEPVSILCKKDAWMTKSVQSNFDLAVFNWMFDEKFHVRKDFYDVEALRRRFKTLAVVNFFLSPFLAIFMTFYFVLHNAERFYHQPSAVGTREWSSIAFWKMREFNELPHFARWRLNAAHKYATRYVQQFPNPITDICAKFVAYIVGAFAACALLLALVDDRLLNAYIGNRDVFWLTASLGAVLATSRAFIVEENVAFEPNLAMARVVAHTHHFPKYWRKSAHKLEVKNEFTNELFPLKATTFFEELIGIFLCPFVLWFPLSDSAGDIVEFVRNSTARVSGIGDVCSLSVFDFSKHGNKRYGAKTNARKHMRSRQGKMEKSFLSFTEAYPGWSPSGPGIEVLDNLRRFATKHESVVMSKSLHFGGAFPPRSMSPQAMGGVTTPPGSFHHHHHHANSVMRGSSIFRERNDDDAKRKKRGGKSFVDGIDDIIVTPSSSSNKFSGRSSLRRGRGRAGGGGEGEEQQLASSTMVAGDEELPLLDAWLASTASSHQVMQCFYERALEREEDDSANSGSESDYDNDTNEVRMDEEEGNANFIDDIANVLSSQTTTNVDLI